MERLDNTKYCNWMDCGDPISEEEETIIVRYVGGQGHLVHMGYHQKCFVKYLRNERLMEEILAEKKWQEVWK